MLYYRKALAERYKILKSEEKLAEKLDNICPPETPIEKLLEKVTTVYALITMGNHTLLWNTFYNNILV